MSLLLVPAEIGSEWVQRRVLIGLRKREGMSAGNAKMGDEGGDELEAANHKRQCGKVRRIVKEATRDAVDAINLVPVLIQFTVYCSLRRDEIRQFNEWG